MNLNQELHRQFRIYGKAKNMKRFLPLDIRQRNFAQNLFYATILEESEANTLLESVALLNPDIQFLIKLIKG